MNQGKPI